MSVSIVLGGLVLGALVPQETDRGTLLARIPEGLVIPSERFFRNNIGANWDRSSSAWSEDGRIVAYAAQRGEEYVPVVGSEVGKPFGYVYAPVVAGGHAFFHVARSKGEDKEQHWLWVDGKTLGPEDWIGELAVRADGKQACYWTGPGARFGSVTTGSQKNVLVMATDKGSQWSLARGDDWLDSGVIRYATGGASACTAALERNKGWTVLKAEKREPKLCEPCDRIESFALSADGSGLAFVRIGPARGTSSGFPTEADESQLFFRGKRVGQRHPVVSSATVDAAGVHVAYVVTREGLRTAAIDEESSPRGAYDFVLDLVFDPSGTKLAFVVVRGGHEEEDRRIVDGQWSVAVRGLTGSEDPLEQEGFLEVRDLRWDPRGERLAYCARDDKGWCVVCGETRSAPHADVGPPVFSAAGTLGFGSRDVDSLWWRELDLPGSEPSPR